MYNIFYELFLMFYDSAEDEYEYIKLANPNIFNPIFCLFYTILFCLKKLIFFIFLSALPISVGLSIITVVSSLVFLNSKVSHTFGINLIQFIPYFSGLELARDISFYLLCLFAVLATLLTLGTELYEWANHLNMGADERMGQIDNISSHSFNEAEDYMDSIGQNKIYMDKFIQHCDEFEPIALEVEQLLEQTNDEMLNNSFTIYISNIAEIWKTFDKSGNRIPADKFQQLIPKIQKLDKQKKDLETMIAKVQKKLENPFESSIFFNGCNSSEKLDKRYKTLCKAYHPDGSDGDEETFKKMKDEYETLKREFA